MYIYQSIKHFTAAFLFATGGYAAQAQTTDAGIMPFLGLETNARTAGMAGGQQLRTIRWPFTPMPR